MPASVRASHPRSAAPAASAASSSHRAIRMSSAVGGCSSGGTGGTPVIHQAFPSMGSIKIARLLEDRDYGLQLTLVTGAEGLGRVITSSRIQKPGLALAGFTEHLHPERVQVFGNTEISYLNTLDEATQREALKKLSDSDLACVVVTKDLPIPRSLVDACSAAQLALMKTPLLSSTFIQQVTGFLDEALTESASLHGVLMDVIEIGRA